MDLVLRCFAGDEVDFDLEIFAGFAEGSMGSFWEDHLGLGDAAFLVGFVPCAQAGHEDRFGATAGRDTAGALWAIEK